MCSAGTQMIKKKSIPWMMQWDSFDTSSLNGKAYPCCICTMTENLNDKKIQTTCRADIVLILLDSLYLRSDTHSSSFARLLSVVNLLFNRIKWYILFQLKQYHNVLH